MNNETARICVEIFHTLTGFKNTPRGATMSDDDILSASIKSLDIDSLGTMEFVLAVEDRFNVELNEEAVNRCQNLRELAALTETARRV